jgi:hypothetical protein
MADVMRTIEYGPVLLSRRTAETARIKWGEVKSKGGGKKQYPTQGYACLNLTCASFGHTDERIRALIRHTTR